MGSNVFKLPGIGIFHHAAVLTDAEAASESSPTYFPSAYAIPSFRRRPASSLAPAGASGENWGISARRRAALRLVEPPDADSPAAHLPQPPTPPQPLRVMRLIEAGQAPGVAGRLRLSGRMADVCAELDRMAAAESSVGTHARRA